MEKVKAIEFVMEDFPEKARKGRHPTKSMRLCACVRSWGKHRDGHSFLGPKKRESVRNNYVSDSNYSQKD